MHAVARNITIRLAQEFVTATGRLLSQADDSGFVAFLHRINLPE
jgi:hypothetical protein